jgi:hypothetical protein
MKTISFLSLALLLASTAFASESLPQPECFDEPPGEFNVPFDKIGSVKITAISISEGGEKAFVTTEYLGSVNLQAAVYLYRDKKYCFAGDLGSAINFRSDKRIRSGKYFSLMVESKSGPDKFFRNFKYQTGQYILSECKVKPVGSRMRKCTASEE